MFYDCFCAGVKIRRVSKTNVIETGLRTESRNTIVNYEARAHSNILLF